MKADSALKELMAGNRRYASGRSVHPFHGKDRRKEVLAGQKPIAVIVGCADSRVPPEILFDEGIGRLFVVRAAGNVVGRSAMGSVEYAVEHLGVRLVMVLGHSKCGAVTATVQGGHFPGSIKDIAEAIRPAVERAMKQKGDILDNSIRENVKLVAKRVRLEDPILKKTRGLKVVGAVYHLETGKVELI